MSRLARWHGGRRGWSCRRGSCARGRRGSCGRAGVVASTHLAHRVLPDVFELEQAQRLVQKVDGAEAHGAQHVRRARARRHQHHRRVLKRVDEGAAGGLVGRHHARLRGRGGEGGQEARGVSAGGAGVQGRRRAVNGWCAGAEPGRGGRYRSQAQVGAVGGGRAARSPARADPEGCRPSPRPGRRQKRPRLDLPQM